MKKIKYINADNKAKKLKITFEDGTLGQFTFKQIESLYGMFYLPDMQAKLPHVAGEYVGEYIGEYIPPKIQAKKKNMMPSNFGLGAVNPTQNLNSTVVYNQSNLSE